MTTEEYFGDWCSILDMDEVIEMRQYLQHLQSLKEPICPDVRNVFKAFNLCKLHSLRVLILGMDPYPGYINGVPRATGVAFANDRNIPPRDFSPSLQILMNSIIDFSIPHKSIIFDPTLEDISKQGVLFLNTALSCLKGKTCSHTLLWRPFTRRLLARLSTRTAGIVYVLMGNDAQSLEGYINPTGNHILKCRHPAYHARTGTAMPSDIWKRIDAILIGQNGYGIKWYKEE